MSRFSAAWTRARREPWLAVAGVLVVVSCLLSASAAYATYQMRRDDCDQALARQAADEQNDLDLVRDIADGVVAQGGRVDSAIVDDITGRIRHRYDRLPPPPDCDP